METALDGPKNEGRWGGFVPQDLNQTRIMVRLNALTYNWWSLFVRMIDSGSHLNIDGLLQRCRLQLDAHERT